MKYNSLEEVEEDLSSMKRGFLLKFVEELKFKNYQEVLEYAVMKNSINNRLPTTVYAKSGGIQCQCMIGRGITDLWRICKYYFPNTKLCDVINYFKNNTKNKRIQYCSTTIQTVIRTDNYSSYNEDIVIRGRKMKGFKIK